MPPPGTFSLIFRTARRKKMRKAQEYALTGGVGVDKWGMYGTAGSASARDGQWREPPLR